MPNNLSYPESVKSGYDYGIVRRDSRYTKMKSLKKIFLLFAPALVVFSVGGAYFAQTAYAVQQKDVGTVTEQEMQSDLKKNIIVEDLNTLINFLSAGVGIIVVIAIIVGGVQYAMAGDNPSAVSAAKERIINALIALAVFLFMAAFLQWLVPGGVFK